MLYREDLKMFCAHLPSSVLDKLIDIYDGLEIAKDGLLAGCHCPKTLKSDLDKCAACRAFARIKGLTNGQ